jgi:hypothetical protein
MKNRKKATIDWKQEKKKRSNVKGRMKMSVTFVLRNNASLNNKPKTYRQKRCRGTGEEHYRGKAGGFVRSTKAKAGSQGGAPLRQGRRFRAEHRGEAEEDHRGDAKEPRRTTTKGEADKEWEHCRGRHRNMGAPQRPTPRNQQGRGWRRGMGEPLRPTPRSGSTADAEAEAKQWEQCRGQRRGMGLHKGRNQHQGTPKTEGPSDNQQSTGDGLTERKNEWKGWSKQLRRKQWQWWSKTKQSEGNKAQSREKRKPTWPQWWRLTLWWKAAAECGLGPSDPPSSFFEVAEVVECQMWEYPLLANAGYGWVITLVL